MYEYGKDIGDFIPIKSFELLISQQFSRWQFVTVLDVLVEVILVCLSAILVHDLKMPLTRKAVVVIAFLFRLPCV